MPSSILKKQEITDFGQQLRFWTAATYFGQQLHILDNSYIC